MTPVECFFFELGRDIADRWEAFGWSRRAFAAIAEDGLETYVPQAPSGADLLASVVHGMPLPPQGRMDEGFGQPSLTLYSEAQFRIDALFWESASLAIHEHGFCGAFAVLEGASLAARYRFARTERPAPHFEVGALSLTDIELLKTGEVRQIPAGRGLVHSVYHLERPSVSLVVKTNGRAARGEYMFHAPHVAFEPSRLGATTVKSLQALELMIRLGRPEVFLDLALSAIAVADIAGAYQILLKTLQQVRQEAIQRQVITAFEARGWAAAAPVLASAQAECQRDRLVSLKGQLATTEGRLAAALLATAEHRYDVLRIVAEYAGGANPGQAMLRRGVSEILQAQASRIPDTAVGRALIEAAVRGQTREEFLRALAPNLGDGVDVHADQLLSAYDRLITAGPFAALAA